MKTLKLSMAIALILSGAMASGAAFAARPDNPGGGGGGGSGGRPGGETAAQNLSVPGILVGPLGTLVCGPSADAPTNLLAPTGTPLTGYELDPTAYYWVQKVHVWQAQCFNDTGVDVFGAWGDNITGDAKLTTGAPIRVEIVLTNRTDYTGTIPPAGTETPTLEGYTVVKLQPSLEDRVSAWGHLASGDGTTTNPWSANPIAFAQSDWVVHDAGMKIEIFNTDTGANAVPLQAIAPEINASGKIVYGYNLRVTTAGTYTIHFNAPNVTIKGVDAGTFDANNAYLDIVVTAKNTGGAGGGGKPNR